MKIIKMDSDYETSNSSAAHYLNCLDVFLVDYKWHMSSEIMINEPHKICKDTGVFRLGEQVKSARPKASEFISLRMHDKCSRLLFSALFFCCS